MRRQRNEYSVNCLVLNFVNCLLTASVQKNKVPPQIGCRIALSKFMYGYLLTIAQAIGYPWIYICLIVSSRNFSNLDFRSSVRIISQTCDNFITDQKIVCL